MTAQQPPSRNEVYSDYEINAVADTAQESVLDSLSNPLSALKDRLRAAVDRLPPSLSRSRALHLLDCCATLSDSVHTIMRTIDQMTEIVDLLVEELPRA